MKWIGVGSGIGSEAVVVVVDEREVEVDGKGVFIFEIPDILTLETTQLMLSITLLGVLEARFYFRGVHLVSGGFSPLLKNRIYSAFGVEKYLIGRKSSSIRDG